MLTSGDSKISFKLDGDLLGTMTIYDFNVIHSNPQDQKLNYEFGKAINFNIKQKGQKNPRDQSLSKLHKSPAIMASEFSTIFLSSDPYELCDKLKLLLQEEQVGINSNKIDRKVVAIADKLLENKCISKKQHNFLLSKLLN